MGTARRRMAFYIRLAVVILLPTADAFDWTNEKITTCARERRARGLPWLTANNASYICTNEQWDKYYDPSNSVATFLTDFGVTTPVAASCPSKTHTMQCVVFASWGQVAGGPDSCTDKCSTAMETGEKSCCAKACTTSSCVDEVWSACPDMNAEACKACGESHGEKLKKSCKYWPQDMEQACDLRPGPSPGPTPSPSPAKCYNNHWINNVSGKCGNKFANGYCDCCPNCYECVHGPHPVASPAAGEQVGRSLVANRFCDCRKGLNVSDDYTPCWNSCLDCFGDDGQVQYMPQDVAVSCLGKTSCYVKVEASSDGDYWYKCDSEKLSSCTKSTYSSGIVPQPSKAKGIMLCGPAGEITV